MDQNYESDAFESDLMHINAKRKRAAPPTLRMPSSVLIEIASKTTTNSLVKITPSLYISGHSIASDIQVLRSEGITHILNLVGEHKCLNQFSEEFYYETLKLPDNPRIDILFFLYFAIEFISSAVQNGGKVLVHCLKGISRAPTIACAYLMHSEGINDTDALQRIKSLHSEADPNIGFICQLKMFGEREQERRLFTYSEKYDMFVNDSEEKNLSLTIADDTLTMMCRDECRGRENDCGLMCANL